MRKKDIQLINGKTFRIKNVKTILKQYLNEIKDQQKVGNSFSGTILPMNVVYFSLIAGFIFYITFAIVLFKLLQPHMGSLQVLFSAKSPLLMIMISIPFMAVFFLVMYYLFRQTVLKKHLIEIDWSHSLYGKQKI